MLAPASRMHLNPTEPYCSYCIVKRRICTTRRCLDAMLEDGLPLDVELSSGAHRCEVALSRPGSGCWRCAYTPPAPGFYRLQLSSRGAPLGGSPFSVQVPSA